MRIHPLTVAMLVISLPAHADPVTLGEVTVTGTREGELLSETPASVGLIKADTIRQDKPNHPSQIMSQVPGVYVSITNGEGHATAIRQPITTSPVYLYLEDGIPTRSTGFFNHNALYEINIPAAGGIEISKGPGTALYGSDAIGGVINVLTRTPPSRGEFTASGELGEHGWWRTLLGGGNAYDQGAWRGDVNLTHSDGWRDKTTYDRQATTLRWDHAIGDGLLKTVLGYSHVDQETGANAPLVLADYLNNPTRNYHAIAYRKVDALRLSADWEKESGDTLVSITPYLRDDSMDLLASFTLSSDPTVYTSHNRSIGVLAKWRRDFVPMRARLIAGLDLDISPGGREEDRIAVTSSGAGASRVYTAYTLGSRIYDYDVTYMGASPYLHGEFSPGDNLRVQAGLRYDNLRYKFDNSLGGAVATGGSFYGQASDTTVRFEHLSPKLGATWAVNPETHLFASWYHAFRAPSESQLFRPTRGTTAPIAQANAQAALGLAPVKADQIEFGLRGKLAKLDYDFSLYQIDKRDDILSYRDPATNITQSVNAGKTRHRGLEAGLGIPLGGQFHLDIAVSWARHTYEEWLIPGTADYSGKEMEAAPRVIANTRLSWLPAPETRVQLEWLRLGLYWLDQANSGKYGGHDLYNLRANWSLTKVVNLFGSIQNLTDKRYADSASISSGTQVFSPGLPRTAYLGMEAKW